MLAGAPKSLPYRGWTENGLARRASRAELEITAVQPAADTVALDLAGGLVDAGRLGDSEAERWAAQVWLAARALPAPVRSEVVQVYAPSVAAVLDRSVAEQWEWFGNLLGRP